MQINIMLNGAPHQVAAPTVAALLESLGLPNRKVAVEHNLVIVPRSLYAQTPLQAGDRIEIVQFVGGG